ncbi:MAG: flavodoxin family protein [Candidatus Bipolaricaulis sp.]|nr:flavodoxin family protein [Candidatus Bipolaricaulis sp.]
MKTLLVLYSYHHKNTEAVARAFAQILGAPIVTPQEVNPAELAACDLVGFGSGIDSGRHYAPLLALADRLPTVSAKKAFIFSTCGAPAFGVTRSFILKNHSALREKLQAKGYTIVDEFGCPGWNTNKLLRFFGGLNRGRPNAEDLQRAEDSARNLEARMGDPGQSLPLDVTN